MLLTQLRWIAATGQVLTILFVQYVLKIELPLWPMGLVVLLLLGLNVATLWRHRHGHPVSNPELFVQLLLDVALLTVQLYFSGGASNPFVMLFLLQIILSAVLLEAWSAWALVGVTIACFLALMGDTIRLKLPPGSEHFMAPLQLQGSLICFLLTAGLLVFFIEKINSNLRQRDARLADLRRQAAEEEHIVRMGLLASGAAHELGTPLATLSVILNDWRKMPEITRNPEIAQEMEDMQTQLDRCKAIVSGILMSSGEARGEMVVETTVGTFLDELVEEWRAVRSPQRMDYWNGFHPDQPILSDPALKQVVASLFDNALEASPGWIGVTATRKANVLIITIDDKGPGFDAEMLSEFGKPYRSSKNRPGGGLGLYLVVNVVRKLGGTVSAQNRATGGASVVLTLPLSRLSAETPDGG
nr:ATP-binding protein [Acuticoccus mangrovi]